MRRCIALLILLTCQRVVAQEPAAPPILVLDSGGHSSVVTKVLFTLALAATAGGRLLLASGSYDNTARIWDPATGECQRVLEGHTDSVRGIAFAPDASRLATASLDKTARIWSVADGRLHQASQHGLFGSHLARPHNGGHGGGRFQRNLPLEIHKSLNRPDVIKLALKTGSVASALQRRKEPVKVVQEVLPPLVVITSPDHTGVRVNNPELTVRAKARARSGHPIRAWRLLVDERPYNGDEGRKDVAGEPAGGEERFESWQIRLELGRHRLAVVAESDVREGRSEKIEVVYDEQRALTPRLYALLVGVADYEDDSLKLKYADDDAKLLEDVLRASSAKAFAGVPPDIRRLVNRKATKEAFLSGLRWLKDSMKNQDVGIIFFSGHGYRDDDGIFYMLPAEVKRQSIDATALDGALFKRELAGIKGRLVVILDACHAGAGDKDVGALGKHKTPHLITAPKTCKSSSAYTWTRASRSSNGKLS